ncbi:hypothetical protein K440DRAFT_572542 [Wilcoxina mikolae CBS 423.85]|nr:hypothetical protein K440DRAFT_572542 [Wilcoxina mikolae CBS 423.85]
MADSNGEQQQPDFAAMQQATVELATNLGRMRNVPAFDGGALILAELRAIRTDMVEMERRIMDSQRMTLARLEASDYNTVARLTNSALAVTPESQLIQLRTPRNEEVEDFPMTSADIDGASWQELNRLLQSYGLPTQGTVFVRRKQLKKYIGIVMAGI